jgi:hypothetical protein
MIVFTDRVEVPAHVMVRFLDHESVFLNLETERYFGYQQLLSEFEVEPETLRSDLIGLLEKLVENNLLQMVRSDVGTASTI